MGRKKKAQEEMFYAVAYYRLSKEDRNKQNGAVVSNSIENQRKIVQNYVSYHSNIKIVAEAIDDGYTGTNFERPGFRQVMSYLEEGLANMVIVKDLSRMGREYIETGKYIEVKFMEMGVRFISINESVDTFDESDNSGIILPFMNLMNENYCRELSNKLRRQFKVQRENGEFINNFACYGYKRDPEDKHKLIVDEVTADVVRLIYTYAVQGYSPFRIANALNDANIMAPYAYKKSISNYESGFKGREDNGWNHMTIRRILTNSMYTGELCQGKTKTPSFKVKKVIKLERSEWSITPNTHEAIIPLSLFNLVQKELSRDIRMSETENAVFPLVGYIFCGDCGAPMHHRSVKSGEAKKSYYWCRTYKKSRKCSTHNISKELLERAVLNSIRKQIEVIVELERLASMVDKDEIANRKIRRLESMLEKNELELEKLRDTSTKLYDSYADGLLTREDYKMMKERYVIRMKNSERSSEELKQEIYRAKEEKADPLNWIMQFIRYRDIKELTHEAVVTMIDRVDVYEDKRINIIFNFANQMQELEEYIFSSQKGCDTWHERED